MKWFSRILKTIVGIIAVMTVVLGGATLMLNTESVQNKLLKRATEYLTAKLNTKVEIDSISVNLFAHKIRLYGIDIEDQQQRKMLQVEELSADIGLAKLLQKQVLIEKASAEGVKALLLKPKDEPANFQFIIDAFKKKPKAETEQETETRQEKKDNLKFDFNRLLLKRIDIKYNETTIHLNEAGYKDNWVGKQELNIDGLRLQTDNHLPRKNANKPKSGFFDMGHLDVTANLKWTIEQIGKDTLIATLTEGNARDSITGINITDLRFKLNANKETAHISDLVVQQTDTRFTINSADILLPNKKENKKLSFTTDLVTGRAILKDISRPFTQALKNFKIPLNLSLKMSGTDSTLSFRDVSINTDDKQLRLAASGHITGLKHSKQLAVRFKVSKMHVKNAMAERIINQFSVKRLMMKQFRALGDISYTGNFAVLWRKEQFSGALQTKHGPLHFQFTLDEDKKYISGSAQTKNYRLGKVLDIKLIGDATCKADFNIDISKARTAAIRQRNGGGKLPIGTVNAIVVDCSYNGIHVRNLMVNIKSNGAIATGDILQRGMRRDLYCSFSFTDNEQMHKMRITKPGIKFHKISDEDRKAKAKRKQEKKAAKELKKQNSEKNKRK